MTETRPLSPSELALVTGASRGIGGATAEALAGSRRSCILVARSASALEEIEERIHAARGNATIAPLDLTEGDSHRQAWLRAVAERGASSMPWFSTPRSSALLTPVQDIDPKEYSRVLTPQPARQPGAHCGVDCFARPSGPTSSPSPRRSARTRTPSGAPMVCRRPRSITCSPPTRTRLGHTRPHPGPHRRSRRDPHADAGARLSGRGTGKRQAARDGRRGDPGAADPRRTDRRTELRRGLRRPVTA